MSWRIRPRIWIGLGVMLAGTILGVVVGFDLGWSLFLTIMVALYWLPTLVAYDHRHRQRQAIGTLNFLPGWTFIGWVVALVWAKTR
jgi:hypothetical protein